MATASAPAFAVPLQRQGIFTDEAHHRMNGYSISRYVIKIKVLLYQSTQFYSNVYEPWFNPTVKEQRPGIRKVMEYGSYRIKLKPLPRMRRAQMDIVLRFVDEGLLHRECQLPWIIEHAPHPPHERVDTAPESGVCGKKRKERTCKLLL
jgi:hypothetical protein